MILTHSQYKMKGDKRKKGFYIFDSTHNRKAIDKIKTCEVAAKLRLYVGSKYTEEDTRKYWTQKYNYPSAKKIGKLIRVKNLKWYINTYSKELIEGSGWHPDFLMGMLTWGKILFYAKKFPSFIWFGNYELLLTIHSLPFVGTLNVKEEQTDNRYIWSCVPALCFNYSIESVEYLAGVLSTGQIVKQDKIVLARYNRKVGRILKSYNIPIVKQDFKSVYISPFWGVIMQKHMPKSLQDKWRMIPHAYRAKEYSAILWKVYTGEDPFVNGMPYLMSRRSIFYKYGSIKTLREMWIKNQLVELDSRFKIVVQEWQKNV